MAKQLIVATNTQIVKL